jgi:hypothetical protein
MKPRTLLRFAGLLALAAEAAFVAWQLGERRVLERALAAEQAETRSLAALGRRAADLENSLRKSAKTGTAQPAARPSPGSFADRFGTALKDPAFLRKLSLVQRRAIGEHYGPLFDRLHLTPEQRERFGALLAEKQLAKTDAEAAANSMIGTGLMIPAITAAQADVNAEIRQELGPVGYQEYYNFEMTDGLRTTVKRLQDSLRYTSAPLSDTQAEAVVGALDEITPAETRGGIAKFTGASVEVATGLVTQQFSAPLPDQAPAAAQALLSPPQLAQLRSLMLQQQDELQLRSHSLAALRAAQSPAP